MKSITLVLKNRHGDELGRLLVAGVVIADAHDAGQAPVRPGLKSSMDDIYSRVRQTVYDEGLEISLDELDFNIEVSRGLLGGDSGDVLLSLPVRELSQSNRSSTKANDTTSQVSRTESGSQDMNVETARGEMPNILRADELDDLFRIDKTEEVCK